MNPGPRWGIRFIGGARDTIPLALGALPFGIIFGAVAAAGPLSLWQAQLMSLLVFAGSSQFIALGLIAGHAGMVVIWLTTGIVNMRHLLYGAVLLPDVARLPARWRWALGFLLTDETFAVVAGHFRRQPEGVHRHWYFLGSAVTLYVTWQLGTLAGLCFGQAIPQLQACGLDFAMIATFIAIVVPQLVGLAPVAAALVAGGVALIGADWPYRSGLMAAVVGGVVTGMVVSMVRGRGRMMVHHE
ncbi:MAG: AzlC family ABC transporter permease [Azospirillaceae bacterium]|nr:AzlC family ABC transporter permease [Azospirillaceae bacterium]